MERLDVPVNETWDLTLIYKNKDEFFEDEKRAQSLLSSLRERKDCFTKSKEDFHTFYEDYVTLSRLLSKMYEYAHLNTDVEPGNQDYQLLLSHVLTLFDQFENNLDFMNVEIIKNKEAIEKYLEDNSFDLYRYQIKQILREEKHMLSQEMETLLSKMSPIANTGEQIFDALRLEYEDVIVDGERKTLNSATLNEFLKNPSQEVRKQAYEKFYKEYKRYENVFALTLADCMKKDAFYADVRHFNDPLDYSLWDDDVPRELFYKILDKANKDYRSLFHRYNKLKKELLKLDTLYNYDLFTPLVKPSVKRYSIDECFNIILDVTSVFGEEYTDIIKKARDERWIDYHPTKGKATGAYSAGCYDTKPYILTNFIGDYDSLSTLIHELGHSCHTYLSCKYQDPANSDYRIFVAEVASTVNETLLINHMISHAKSDEEKAYFLYEFLENCVGLIFRQPMYAQFEDTLHQWAKDHIPMNASKITSLYDKINKEYYGEDVTNNQYVGHSCFYIPHFYYNYYVYKYTLGMTVALAIVSRILNHDSQQVEQYLSFLKSGGSMSPIDLLKKAGVDPLDDKIYDDAFHYFEHLLNMFEEIMKRGEKDVKE